MTDIKSTGTAEVPLGRLWLNLARYYLGNRWVLLALGSAVIIGAAAFNWGWLVAVGLAPLLLTLAPCAIMCAVGLCSMGGKKESARLPNVGEAAGSSAAPHVAKADGPSVATSGCCHEEVAETPSVAVTQAQPVEERKDSHA